VSKNKTGLPAPAPEDLKQSQKDPRKCPNEILYLNIFRKFVENIQALLKSYKNKGTLRADQYTFSIQFFSE
jgi:hypothetical protein